MSTSKLSIGIFLLVCGLISRTSSQEFGATTSDVHDWSRHFSAQFLAQPSDVTVIVDDPIGVPPKPSTKFVEGIPFRCDVEGAVETRWWLDDVEVDVAKDTGLSYTRGTTLYLRPSHVSRSRTSVVCGFDLPDHAGIVLSRRALLTVFDFHSWLSQPQNVSVAPANSFRLGCRLAQDDLGYAAGVGRGELVPVEYSWTKDGVALDLADKRLILLDSNRLLHVANTTSAQTGRYACTARLGDHILDVRQSQTATVTLLPQSTTTSDSPARIVSPPQSQLVLEGQRAVLECLVEGRPWPDVRWKREDDTALPIDTTRVTAIHSSLVLNQFQAHDEGTYACYVQNRPTAVLRAAAKLQLARRPAFTQPPQNQVVERGDTARFHCTATGQPRPDIVWYRNGKPLTEYGRLKLFPPMDLPPAVLLPPRQSGATPTQYNRDLVVSEAQGSDAGVYQCFVNSSTGGLTGAAMLKVDSPNDTSTKHAWQLSSTPVADNRIRLTWTKPNYPVTAYFISYHELHDGIANNEPVGQLHKHCTATHCSYDCCQSTPLAPDTTYVFSVTAINAQSKMEPRSEEIQAETMDAVPTSAPSLTVRVLSDNSAQLHWRPLDTEHSNGDVTGYKVQWRKDGAGRANEVAVDADSRIYEIDDLTPNTRHLIRVEARTSQGYARERDADLFPWVSFDGANASTAVLGAPQLFVATTVNSTAIRATWQPITAAQRYHVAVYKEGVLDLLIAERYVEQTSLTLNGLAFGVYSVRATGVDSEGREGMESRAALRMPVPDVPQAPNKARVIVEPPDGVQCNVRPDGAVVVKWNAPVTNRKVVRFAVRQDVSDKDGVIDSENTEFIDVSDRMYSNGKLRPGRTYVFAVRSYDHMGYSGPFSSSARCTTPVAVPEPPFDLQVSLVSKLEVQLSWSPPLNDGGSPIERYYVYHSTQEGELPTIGNMPSPDATSLARFPLLLTDASTRYYVAVAAVNAKGAGSVSEVLDFTAAELNRRLVSNKEVVVVSYKEGVVVGVGIVLLCGLAAVLILLMRSRCCPSARSSHSFFFLPSGPPAATPSKSTSHNEPCWLEMQQIMMTQGEKEALVCQDTKGADDSGSFYRGTPKLFTAVPHNCNGHQTQPLLMNGYGASSLPSDTTPLTVLVPANGCGLQPRADSCSHCGRGASTLDSLSLQESSPTSSLGNPDPDHHRPSRAALPPVQRRRTKCSHTGHHLVDSGIGFDERSGSPAEPTTLKHNMLAPEIGYAGFQPPPNQHAAAIATANHTSCACHCNTAET